MLEYIAVFFDWCRSLFLELKQSYENYTTAGKVVLFPLEVIGKVGIVAVICVSWAVGYVLIRLTDLLQYVLSLPTVSAWLSKVWSRILSVFYCGDLTSGDESIGCGHDCTCKAVPNGDRDSEPCACGCAGQGADSVEKDSSECEGSQDASSQDDDGVYATL